MKEKQRVLELKEKQLHELDEALRKNSEDLKSYELRLHDELDALSNVDGASDVANDSKKRKKSR
jgi:hypothetical protein